MKLWSKRRAWYFLRKQDLDPFAGAVQDWWNNKAVVWVACKNKSTKLGNVVSIQVYIIIIYHNYIYASDLWKSAQNGQKIWPSEK